MAGSGPRSRLSAYTPRAAPGPTKIAAGSDVGFSGGPAHRRRSEKQSSLSLFFFSLFCPGQDLAYRVYLAARGRMLPTAARSAPLRQQAVRRAILPQGAAGVGEWPGCTRPPLERARYGCAGEVCQTVRMHWSQSRRTDMVRHASSPPLWPKSLATRLCSFTALQVFIW